MRLGVATGAGQTAGAIGATGATRAAATTVLAAAATSLLWLLFVAPLAWMVLSSFKAPAELLRLPPAWLPQEGWRWANYLEVFERVRLGRMLFNSAAVAAAVVGGQLLTGTLAGYVLARVSFRGRGLVLALVLASLVVPDQLAWIPSFRILRGLGLLDTYGALVVPFLAGALTTLILRQQFLTIPREMEEAARLDGCGTWQLFRYVLLPAVVPGLRAAAVLTFLFGWNDLVWPLLMTHRAELRTLPVGLALMQGELGTEWHLLMAASVMMTLPALAAVAWLLVAAPGGLGGWLRAWAAWPVRRGERGVARSTPGPARRGAPAGAPEDPVWERRGEWRGKWHGKWRARRGELS